MGIALSLDVVREGSQGSQQKEDETERTQNGSGLVEDRFEDGDAKIP